MSIQTKRKNRRALVWIIAAAFVFLALSALPKNQGITDKATEAEIYDYLTLQLGYPPAAACGIMSNLKSESNFNSYSLQDSMEKSLGYSDLTYTQAVDSGEYTEKEFASDSAGYGLCQWTYKNRKEGLYRMAKERGTSISDYAMQLDFMDKELGDKKREQLMSYPDTKQGAYDAGYYFCEVFEKPKDDGAPKQRGKAAEKYYKKYAE